jgi:hypothetical protein
MGIIINKIKGKHVIVAGAGFSLKKYWDDINLFIKNNNIITIGCNNVNDVFFPNYNFWGSNTRWKKYGNKVNKKTVLIFPYGEKEKDVRRHWSGSYMEYKTDKRPSRSHSNFKNIYECFKNITMTAIFWAYNQRVSKISIVGMDGYTLYEENSLKSEKESQHCFGKGFTDGSSYKFAYNFCRMKDIKYYEKLKLLHKYGKKEFGFGFEIITPTVYKKFYNPSILNIKENYNIKEPSKKEKKYFGSWKKHKKHKKHKY